MRRPVILFLTFVLALATGATLLGLAAVVTADPSGGAATDTSIARVRAFYAAVNDALRSGDPAPLDALLAPEFVDHHGSGNAASGGDDLKREIAALRATFPDLRLTVEHLIAEPTGVTARVTARGTHRPSFVGIPLRADVVTWGEIDVFRVAGGAIAERWRGQDAASLFQPLGEAFLPDAPTGRTAVALVRFTYLRGKEPAWQIFPGPGLLMVETGTLVLRGNGTARIVRTGQEERHEVAAMGAEIALRGGDAVAVAGSVAVLRNGGPEPAVALGVALLPVDSDRFQRTFLTPNGMPTPTGEVALSMLLPNDGAAVDLPGLRIQPVATGVADGLSAGPAAIGIGRATLLPGSSLPPHEVGGAELFVVETGSLGLDAAGPDQVAELGNEGTAGPNLASPVYLAAGEARLRGAGPTGGARNAGDGSLVVVVVTIRPVASETPTADTALTTSR